MVPICLAVAVKKQSMAIHKCLEVLQNKLFLPTGSEGFLEVGDSRSCTYIKAIMESKRSEETEAFPNLEAPRAMEHSQLPTAILHWVRQAM